MSAGMGVLLLLVGSTGVQAETVIGRVVAVSDGDTLTLQVAGRESVRIRLAGIDAPELDQPYGAQARRALTALARHGTARVEVVDRDDYGRLVGTVYVGGRNINAALVAEGAGVGVSALQSRFTTTHPRSPGKSRASGLVGVASLAARAALGLARPGLAGDPISRPSANGSPGGVISLRRQAHLPGDGQLRRGEVLSQRLRPQAAGRGSRRGAV
jgi:hypothetical protein